jgi:rhodanese-related sulfurtransferase
MSLLLALLFVVSAGAQTAPDGKTMSPPPLPLLNPAAPVAPKPEDSVLRISIDEARAALAKNEVLFVDVRGEVPFHLQHIRGAMSVPLGLVAQRAADLPKDKLIVTYCTCTHDDLSVAAVMELEKVGVTRAAALHGGLRAWDEAGLPIDRAPLEEGNTVEPQTASASRGRLGPPPAVTCDRSSVTSYNGKVTLFKRGQSKTTIRIATDWATVETVVAQKPVYLVNGLPMHERDWKRVGLGGRANVWVCRTPGVEPVIDWRPDEKAAGQ